MKRERFLFIIVTLLAMLFFVLIALWQSGNTPHFFPSDDAIANLNFSHYRFDDEKNELISLKDIEDESQLVVIVRATGNRKLYEYSVLSEVEITDVFKGDFMQGDIIYVHEPIAISVYKDYRHISLDCGYILMQENHEYLVFLKYLPFPDNYSRNDEDLRTFLLVYKQYGKYTNNDVMPLSVVHEVEDNTKYHTIKDYNLYSASSFVQDQYNRLAHEVKESKYFSIDH